MRGERDGFQVGRLGPEQAYDEVGLGAEVEGQAADGHAGAGALLGPAGGDLGLQDEIGGDPRGRGERRILLTVHEDQATDRVRL